jgi:flagellar FliJ protein
MKDNEKSISVLLKIERTRLDERARRLNEARERLAAAHTLRDRLKDEMNEQRRAAGETELGLESLPTYLLRANLRMREIEKIIAHSEAEVDRAMQALSNAFAEVKKLETVQKQRAEKARKQKLRLETKRFDDVGLAGYVRRQEEISSEERSLIA